MHAINRFSYLAKLLKIRQIDFKKERFVLQILFSLI